jgi:DNA recombination protein RmuC
MEQQVIQLAFLIIGLTVGIIPTWLIFRGRIATAVANTLNQYQLDTVRLNERFSALQEENTRHLSTIDEFENEVDSLRNQLNTVQSERTTLVERASRIGALELQLNEESTKNDLLQAKLQEETSRNAKLAEQVAYLPESLEKITKLETEQKSLEQTVANWREKVGSVEATANHQIETIKQLEKEKETLKTEKSGLTQQIQMSMAKNAELTAQLESEMAQGKEKIELLNEAKEQLANQFKALANDILEEKSKRFTEQNQSNIDQILSPLKTKLQEFQGKVEDVYVQEGKDRTALSEQVKQLMSLNQQLSQDAHNLTTALKGQSKTQGNWGEFILEKVLEKSGLNKGEHYKVQESYIREDNSRVQPDVVIFLPEGKHIIVDAKVSIVAYNEYVNADDEETKKDALKRHIVSIRSHIKDLSSKSYQDLHQLNSLDYVIMFVPVEPAFMLALAEDSEIWQEALSKNVFLVSPSTLLCVLRTIDHLWKQEKQNHNAKEIAKCGGDLYNKLTSFVDDLQKIGDRLNQAQKSYDDAFNKFKSGRGNVIKQAEKLKEMGIKTSKSLPISLVEFAIENDQ